MAVFAMIGLIGLLLSGLTAFVFVVMGGWGMGLGARLFITATPDVERTRKAGSAGMLVLLLWLLFGASLGLVSRVDVRWAAAGGLAVGLWRLAVAVRRWYRTQWWRAAITVILAFSIGAVPAAAAGFGAHMTGVVACASIAHHFVGDPDS